MVAKGFSVQNRTRFFADNLLGVVVGGKLQWYEGFSGSGSVFLCI